MKRNACFAILVLAAAVPIAGQENSDNFKKALDGAENNTNTKQPRRPSRAMSRNIAGGGRVVIIYKNQPQAAILEQVESLAAPRKELNQAELSRVTGNAAEALVRERMDRDEIETRRAAKGRIAAALESFQQSKTARLEAAGASNIRRYWSHNMITADVSSDALAMLAEDSDVAEVLPAPVYHVNAAKVANDTIDPNVGVLGLASWWNAGLQGNGQQVVVLDTGINASHPIFAGKQIVAKTFLDGASKDNCFSDDPESTRDNVGHGSHVAGIVAGAGDALLPVFQGTAPGVSKLFALKVGAKLTGRNNCGDNALRLDDIISGIEFALENTSAKIFNMSFGGDTQDDDSVLARIIDVMADTFGATVLVAAGNSGPDGIGDTALTFNGITVANTDTRGTLDKRDDRIAPSSSRGPTIGGRFKPDVAAPGTQILSASNIGSNLVRLTGTSMATPKVAGVVAVLQQSGVKDPAAVKALLINTTDQVGWRADRGWGFINMENARALNTVLTSSVTANGFQLFRGRNTGDFYATLAWNRHLVGGASVFDDLDLFVFDASGTQLASSETAEQNVEQIATATAGDVVVKVKAFDQTFGGNLTRESFALAISQSDFVAAIGPALDARCAADTAAVVRGAAFNLECTVVNNGDIDGQGTQVQLALGGSNNSAASNTLDTLAAGASRSGTFRVTAPAQPGVMDLQFTATTTAAGETFSAATRVQVTVR